MALVAASKLRPELALVVSPTETVAIERIDPGILSGPSPTPLNSPSTRAHFDHSQLADGVLVLGMKMRGQREYGFRHF